MNLEMESSTLVRRSTRIASKNSVEPRAKRAYARATQKENIYDEENSSVRKKYSKSVKISSLSSTGKTVLKSRNRTKSKDMNSLPPCEYDVNTTETYDVKLSKTTEKKNSKSLSFDSTKTESSIGVVIPEQPRRSKRIWEKNDDLKIQSKELIDNHRNLTSLSKKPATTKKELIENGADRSKALVNQVIYEKNEIVMAKMAGHAIWPAKVIFILFHLFMNTLKKKSLLTIYKIS